MRRKREEEGSGSRSHLVETDEASRLQICEDDAEKVSRSPEVFQRVERPSTEENHCYYDTECLWDRTTDFSPSYSIGQSTTFCFEMNNVATDGFLLNEQDKQMFSQFSKTPIEHSAVTLTLMPGTSYCGDSPLVPIVSPPYPIELTFDRVFKISSLVQSGHLSGPVLDAAFYSLVNSLLNSGQALGKLRHFRGCCYDPVSWLKRECYQNIDAPSPETDYIRCAEVTPLRVNFKQRPLTSNRVLRKYSDHFEDFIIVSFRDEEGMRINRSNLYTTKTLFVEERPNSIFYRVLAILRDGITIGSKTFNFLAHSSSQLRSNSTWMFSGGPQLNSNDIRNWMGDFSHIRNVSKHAARLGQCFGSSIETKTIPKEDIEMIDDVKIETDGVTYVFSDGIGTISKELADEIAEICKVSPTPSAFQVRLGGYKGVLATNPTMKAKVCFRPSMCKFESKDSTLDILSWSGPHMLFIGRQIITLLSSLGIPDDVFMQKQEEALEWVSLFKQDPLAAMQDSRMCLTWKSTGVIKDMLIAGFDPAQEVYLSMLLQNIVEPQLNKLQTKTKIFISEGRLLLGCLDETRTLDYGEVFVQISNVKGSESPLVIEKRVVVAKNPCLYPGDVRVLQAVDVPSLRHMVDCIVFPQKGKRPHPDECSGSDLDGDQYFVCWDEKLIPEVTVNPMSYVPAPSVQLDREVTIEDIVENFMQHMANDNLGQISNAHTIYADMTTEKAFSGKCKHLAKLFSTAVDYPKTGVSADVPKFAKNIDLYPDFMGRQHNKSYPSPGILGKLYRRVVQFREGMMQQFRGGRTVDWSFDRDLVVEGYEDYIEEAKTYKERYNAVLSNLMNQHGIAKEMHIITGRVLMGEDNEYHHKVFKAEFKALKEEVRTWFDSSASSVNELAKASAWYHVTYHPRFAGRNEFVSFPWCIYDRLITIKMRRRQS